MRPGVRIRRPARVRSHEPSGPVHGGPELGDHGSPAGRSDRAITSGSLFLAELAAREIGPLTLDLALDLTALAAVKNPAGRSVSRPAGSSAGSPRPGR
jgi:hypothetical protein